MKKKEYIELLLVFIFLVAFPLAIPSAGLATDYYVLPSDANVLNGDGSSSVSALEVGAQGAWNGLDNIAWDKVQAGDKILLQRSMEYYGKIEVLKSGEQGNYITFSTFGEGSNPVITGGKQLSSLSADWRLESLQQRWVCARFADGSWSNGIYNAAINDNKPLKRSYSSDFRYYYGEFANARFNISVFSDSKPWNHKVYVAVLPYNVLIDGKSYIKFDGVDFSLANGWSIPQYGSIHIVNNSRYISFLNCNISRGAYSGFWVNSSDFVSLENCDIFENYCTAFYFRAGASNATISGCKIFKNGKYLSVNNATDTGGLLMGSSDIGRNHLIENNEIYDNGTQTVTDRVEGDKPSGNLAWVKHDGNVWKKNLSSLKRWSGKSTSQGVWFFGIDGKSVEKAGSEDLCSEDLRWFWDKNTETLFLYSVTDPNKTSKKLEIAWKNGVDPAISLWGINDTIVKGNYIHDNFSGGIAVTYTVSKNITIENNRVENNLKNSSLLHYGNRYGVVVSGQGDFIVRGNTIINNGGSEMVGNPLWGGLVISSSSISPCNNTVVENNRILNNGGYQLSWYRYLSGSVFNGAKSDNNEFSGDIPLFHYLTSQFDTLTTYSIASSFDQHSELTGVSSPQNLRLK